MRQRPEQQVVTLKGGDPQSLPITTPQNGDGTSKGDARANPDQAVGGANAKYYRVVKGGKILDPGSGVRCELKAGKEIDSLNYDIAKLKIQGVKVEEIQAEERTLGGFSID